MPLLVIPLSGTKVPASIATPEALAAVETPVHSVLIQARRAARVANTGSVWIGFGSANDAQQWELTPGQTLTLTAPDKKKIDLATIFVDAVTATDGVTWLAQR